MRRWLLPTTPERFDGVGALASCAEEIVSQGKAAELAGLSRVEFFEELHRRRVPACRVTPDQLSEEIHGD
ncbi:UPF0175 family protein [Thioalkalicoccus limnaeus]|uniref:UPF0175 family protein n=1 Tax=Thioalkalicoccus limnaeus TaxID=120681 RepID=A0ABV4BLZ0_9GAMM